MPLYIKEPLIFIIFFFTILGWGAGLEKLFSIKTFFTTIERLALHLAGGMFLISFFILLLGLIGCLDKGLGVFIILLGMPVFYLNWIRNRSFKELYFSSNQILSNEKINSNSINETAIEQSRGSFIQQIIFLFGLILFAGVLFFQLLGCFLSDIGGDSMNYHLSIPKLYLMKGKIFGLPHHCHANMYLGASMLYMWCLTFDKWGVICKLIQWLQIFGTTLFVYCMIYRFLINYSNKSKKIEKSSQPATPLMGNSYIKIVSLLGAAVFLFNLGASHYRSPLHARSDLTAMFYLIAGIFMAYTCFFENEKKSDKKNQISEFIRNLAFAGLFISAAVGVKYTAINFGAMPFFIALLMTKYKIKNTNFNFPMKFIIICFVSFMLFLSPWILRSFVTTGSPMYPAFQSMIKDEYKPPLTGVLEYQSLYKIELRDSFKSLKSFFKYQKGKIYPAVVEGDFLLPILPIISLIFIFRKGTPLFFLGSVGLISFIFFMITPLGQIARLFIVASPISAILLTILMAQLLYKLKYKYILIPIIFLTIFNNLYQHQKIHSAFKHINWYGKPLFSVEDRIKYVKEYCYFHEDIFPVYDYIEKNLPMDSEIFLIEQPLPFYCPRPFITNDHWNPPFHLFKTKYNKAGSIKNLAKMLKDEGITYILVNTDEIPFKEYEEFFKKYTQIIFKNNKAKLYILK